MPLRCPVCKVENSQGPNCRRCKADLSLLWTLEDQRQQALVCAREAFSAGDWSEFLASVSEADDLRSDEETCRLLAVAHLVQRDYQGALRAARRASGVMNDE